METMATTHGRKGAAARTAMLSLTTTLATVLAFAPAYAATVSCPETVTAGPLTTGQQWIVTRSCDVSLAGATSVQVEGDAFLGVPLGPDYTGEVHVTLVDKNTGVTLADCADAGSIPVADFVANPFISIAACTMTKSFSGPSNVQATCTVEGLLAGTFQCSLSN